MAKEFNNYFGNIGRILTNLNKIFDFLYKSKKVPSSNALIPPTANEILNELNRLKRKKSSGSDNLASFFNKAAPLVIVPYMMYFTEFMFNHGVFPNILKISKVIAIFKSGEKCLIENYRPISLLPVFSKVSEKLIKVRILSFINQHNVIYDRQSGFWKKHTTMYHHIDIVTKYYNINNV